jgi:arsenical pump membrane protein
MTPADKYTIVGVTAAAFAAVLIRPWKMPEAIWPIAGALILMSTGLLSASESLNGVLDGLDVYLFLTGMMLMAEVARESGLFDWLAALAASWADGSSRRLFWLVYLVGIIVTVFLSNDATAVVLTPAVATVANRLRIAAPLPFMFACALIANAASFVLPISNPANLVVYGEQMPALASWVASFALPSVLAIAATAVTHYLIVRQELSAPIQVKLTAPKLLGASRSAAAGIALTAIIVLSASSLHWQLGLPTLLSGLLMFAVICLRERSRAPVILRSISWQILPLVAGLFVLVRAIEPTGITAAIGRLLSPGDGMSPWHARAAAAIAALSSNLLNNLPVGLLTGNGLRAAHASPSLSAAVLMGVDLGPNLSVTGSLATLLWLAALRREGLHVDAISFLKVGALVMPPALLLALCV